MAMLAETRRKARSYAEDTGQSLSDQIESALDYLESLSDSLSRGGGRQLKRVRKQAVSAAREADSAVRDNPYAAIGAALALGVLAGLLFRR